MDRQFISTSATPLITLEISGDLRLKGQDSSEVVAKSDNPENITLETKDDQIVLRSNADCTVRVPHLAHVQVKAVHGDAIIKALEGALNVERVDGNLELRSVADTNINRIDGDLSVKNVDGYLSIETIAGDVLARGVQGDFTVIKSINGNLTLIDVGGSVKATTDGNLSVRVDPNPAHEYSLYAHGNLFCRLSEDASVEISVPKANQVMAKLPGIHATTPVQTPYALTLGEGDAKLTLSADGNVILDTHAPDWGMEDLEIDMGKEVEGMADTISQQINQQVDSQVRMIEDQLDAQLSSLTMRLNAAKLSEEQVRRIEDRAREASERATTRAQEKMRRAQAKMEQKMAAMQHRMEVRNREHLRGERHIRRSWSLNIPTPPIPPTPAGEPVSEDERLMILRMLEEKKITMEEAEQLLSALEDKD